MTKENAILSINQVRRSGKNSDLHYTSLSLKIDCDLLSRVNLDGCHGFSVSRFKDFMRIKRDDDAKNHVFTHIKSENARTLRFLTKTIGVEIPDVTSRQVKMPLHVIDGDCLLVKIPKISDLDVVENPKSMENRPSWMDATRGLTGAEASIALDMTRYGSVNRAVKTDQLLTLLRNAGHRIEKISQRLYRVDDDVRSLSDIAEMAHKLDGRSVLIAESA